MSQKKRVSRADFHLRSADKRWDVCPRPMQLRTTQLTCKEMQRRSKGRCLSGSQGVACLQVSRGWSAGVQGTRSRGRAPQAKRSPTTQCSPSQRRLGRYKPPLTFKGPARVKYAVKTCSILPVSVVLCLFFRVSVVLCLFFRVSVVLCSRLFT